MKEQEHCVVGWLPLGLKPQDRLFLEMAVTDDNTEEASRLVKEYGIELPEGLTPLNLCRSWITGIRKAEKHHCQNVIDLQSQGKPIGGMQVLATLTEKGMSNI